MVRIVGVQKSNNANEEFVLLQNQGSMRMSLRGHMLVSESAFLSGDMGDAYHSFTEDVSLGAGQYVVLYSGKGSNRWAKTRDGMVVYHCYMGRGRSVWVQALAPVHIMNVQHSFVERVDKNLLLR